MSKVFDKQHATALIAARKWVASLPRERLGTMAVDAELLAFRRVREAWSYKTRYAAGLADSQQLAISAIWTYLGAGASQRDYFELSTRVVNEHEFWDTWDSNGRGSITAERLMIGRHLDKAFAYPEMLHFFEVGIWDTLFISRCISEGVDSSLALEISERTSA